MKKRVMMAMVAAMGVAVPALAGTTIGYSGQLRNEKGEPLKEPNKQITFALYDTPSGGEALWSAVRNVVLNQEGYFSVELEDDTSVSPTLEEVLQKNSTLYIGLAPKGASTEIAPRQRILATPRAASAKTGVDGFKVSGTARIPTLRAGVIRQQYKDGGEEKYGDLLPQGIIMMWSGSATDVPAGWALCNGQKHGDVQTPDLRGRFIVGYDPNDADYDIVGNTGGAKTVTPTVDQMPQHAHTIDKGKNAVVFSIMHDECMVFGSTTRRWSAYKYDTLTAGGDQPHENRPPYYVLCYIFKL